MQIEYLQSKVTKNREFVENVYNGLWVTFRIVEPKLLLVQVMPNFFLKIPNIWTKFEISKKRIICLICLGDKIFGKIQKNAKGR